MLYRIKDFSDWQRKDEVVSGANEKDWYEKDGQRGLFKFAKVGDNGFVSGEYWSEKMASELFEIVGLRSMSVDIGKIDGRLGSMCYDFTREFGKFTEFNHYLPETKSYYTLEKVKQRLSEDGFFNFILMLVMDCVMGQTDRHSGNFGRLVESVNLAPIYDSGSSLCCRVSPEEATVTLKDKMRMAKYTEKALKTFVWDGEVRYTTHGLIKEIQSNYPREFSWAIERLSFLEDGKINNMLSWFSSAVDLKVLSVVGVSLKHRRDCVLYSQ